MGIGSFPDPSQTWVMRHRIFCAPQKGEGRKGVGKMAEHTQRGQGDQEMFKLFTKQCGMILDDFPGSPGSFKEASGSSARGR